MRCACVLLTPCPVVRVTDPRYAADGLQPRSNLPCCQVLKLPGSSVRGWQRCCARLLWQQQMQPAEVVEGVPRRSRRQAARVPAEEPAAPDEPRQRQRLLCARVPGQAVQLVLDAPALHERGPGPADVHEGAQRAPQQRLVLALDTSHSHAMQRLHWWWELCWGVRCCSQGLARYTLRQSSSRRPKQCPFCRWIPGGISTGWAHRTPRATSCARRSSTLRTSTRTGTAPTALTTSLSSPTTEVRCRAPTAIWFASRILPHAAYLITPWGLNTGEAMQDNSIAIYAVLAGKGLLSLAAVMGSGFRALHACAKDSVVTTQGGVTWVRCSSLPRWASPLRSCRTGTWLQGALSVADARCIASSTDANLLPSFMHHSASLRPMGWPHCLLRCSAFRTMKVLTCCCLGSLAAGAGAANGVGTLNPCTC